MMQKCSNNTFGFYLIENPTLIIGGKYEKECKIYYFFQKKAVLA